MFSVVQFSVSVGISSPPGKQREVEQRRRRPLDYRYTNTFNASGRPYRCAVRISFAFGGFNASLVFAWSIPGPGQIQRAVAREHQTMADEPHHLLDGYKVLDFTHFVAGPTTTRL